MISFTILQYVKSHTGTYNLWGTSVCQLNCKCLNAIGGVTLKVDLLDVKPLLLHTPMNQLEPEERKTVEVVHGAARAIWSLSQSNKNKEAMRRTGCIKLLARLLQSVHEEIVVFTVGTIQQCATQVTFIYFITNVYRHPMRNELNVTAVT